MGCCLGIAGHCLAVVCHCLNVIGYYLAVVGMLFSIIVSTGGPHVMEIQDFMYFLMPAF